jgi:hypothetical protein
MCSAGAEQGNFMALILRFCFKSRCLLLIVEIALRYRCDGAKAPKSLFMIKAANNVAAERINVSPEIMHFVLRGGGFTICYHFVSRMCETPICSVHNSFNLAGRITCSPHPTLL